MTDPLTDGLAVTVITSPNGSNRIYIYSQAQDQWIDRTADVSIENGRFYTTWTNGKRYAYPTTVSSVLELTQAGMYVVGDFLEDMPLFPGGITEVGDKSLVETIAYDANNAVLRLYHLRTGKNYTRSKVGGTWGEWIEQAEAYPLPNEIISTMGVVWSGVGYVFQALYTRYRFDQQIWLANGGVTQEITLAAADPDNNRFDTFYVNNEGEWGVLQGDAAVDPIVKMPDPAIGLYVTHVLVTANTIEPPDLPQGLIYDENVEWAVSCVGGTLDAAATVDPEQGTYHVSWTLLDSGDTLSFITPTPVTLGDYYTIRLGIKPLASLTNQHKIYLSAFLSGAQLGSEIQLPLAKGVSGAYQVIGVSVADFGLMLASQECDEIRLRWYKQGGVVTHAGIYVDYVKFEGGVVPPVVATTIEITGEILATGQTGTPFNAIINEGEAVATLNDTDTFFIRVVGVLKKITWANIKSLLKTYFDTLYVALTGDQTVAGVKTFSSFLVTPSEAPTTDYQVANKKYVDDNAGGGSGGHTILDDEAAPLTQRDDLQITGGAEVTDDALNGRTVIAIHARQHSILSTDDHQADVANAGKILGFAETTGEPAAFETEEYEGTRNHYVQNTVPTIASAAEGDTWTNPDTARSFELFVDGAIKYWIEITPNKITT